MKEKLEDRVCVFCLSGKIEDEEHFMLDCPAFDDARSKMWSKFEQATELKKESLANKEQQLNALIGDRFQPNEDDDKDSPKRKMYRTLMKAIMEYICTSMNKRRGLQEILEGVKPARVDPGTSPVFGPS